MHAGGAYGADAAGGLCAASAVAAAHEAAGWGSGRSGSDPVDDVGEGAVVAAIVGAAVDAVAVTPDDRGVKRCCCMMQDRRGRARRGGISFPVREAGREAAFSHALARTSWLLLWIPSVWKIRRARGSPAKEQPRPAARGVVDRQECRTRGDRAPSRWSDYLVAAAGMERLAPATHLSPSLMPTMVRPAPAVKMAYSLSEPALERFGNESIL